LLQAATANREDVGFPYILTLISRLKKTKTEQKQQLTTTPNDWHEFCF
jgi:hypothetical protein